MKSNRKPQKTNKKMETNYKYSLSSKNGKIDCPKCNKKRLVPYVNNETGESIHPTVGKCDRKNDCGYHNSWIDYFANNPSSYKYEPMRTNKQIRKDVEQKEPSYIEDEVVNKTLTKHKKNNLFRFLIDIIGKETAEEVFSKYVVGSTEKGATIFWQMDCDGNVRTGKVMQYNEDGHRKGDTSTWWMHKMFDDYNLKQCFFGEHLLKLDDDKTKPVAIVESEKTALIASVYLPNFIWLAGGSSTGLGVEKMRALKGRNVILYPDLGMFDDWKKKAEEYKAHYKISVSNLLERIATDDERKKGLDLADYLVEYPLTLMENTE
jgi:hypothetical protein